jgi:hypothetical protein
VILNSQDIPLEKFVWDTSNLPVIPLGDLDSPYSLPYPLLLPLSQSPAPCISSSPQHHIESPAHCFSTSNEIDDRIVNATIRKQEVEDSLRAAMIRTAYSEANLTPIPENCTFTLTIEMRDENTRPGNVPPSSLSLCVLFHHNHSTVSADLYPEQLWGPCLSVRRY